MIIRVFLDTEFTHLIDGFNPEPAVLISIGAVTQDGSQHFYAENEDVQCELCSDFTKERVLPLLEGGKKLMPYRQIANELRNWVEQLSEQVEFLTDSPYYDWPFVSHLFDTYSWPVNLRHSPIPLIFESSTLQQEFEKGVAEAFEKESSLQRHHALDDAVANCISFQRTMEFTNSKLYEAHQTADQTQVLARINMVFGQEKGQAWLNKPNLALNGKSPIEMLKTPEGMQIVLRILNAISHGGVA